MQIVKYLIIFCCFLNCITLYSQNINNYEKGLSTYSIIAWDSITNDLGVGVLSKLICVGAIVPYAKAQVGAITIQGITNALEGQKVLDLLQSGYKAEQALYTLLQNTSDNSLRQIGIIDVKGNTAAFTGKDCKFWSGHVTGKGYIILGYSISSGEVLKSMANAFEISTGSLADRIIATLETGEKIEKNNTLSSATLLVVRENGGYNGFNDRLVDIRVDYDSLPLVELRRIYKLWQKAHLDDAQIRSIEEFKRKKNFFAVEIIKKQIVEELNNSLQNSPDDALVLSYAAWKLSIYDIDKERALELVKRAIRLAPNNPKILSVLAECHYNLGHYDEAIAIVKELALKEPTNDELWRNLQRYQEGKHKQ